MEISIKFINKNKNFIQIFDALKFNVILRNFISLIFYDCFLKKMV
jgi:hypothetical protein